MTERRVPFLAPWAAAAAKPAIDAARRALARPVTEVPCPLCGRACALWDPRTRLLHHVAGDGGIGAPLDSDCTANAAVRCDRCRRTWHISGRAVGRNRHNGRPLLPL